MLLHKIDLLPYTRFSRDAAVADARRVNPEIAVVETSCLAEPGLAAWLRWLEMQLALKRQAGRPARG
jgi:hydrogenase nickel incorporation protein HypB